MANQFYIYVNCDCIQITGHCPAGYTITDDPADIVRDIDQETASYVYPCDDLQALADFLCDGSALAAAGITDDQQFAVEFMHARIVGYMNEIDFLEWE